MMKRYTLAAFMFLVSGLAHAVDKEIFLNEFKNEFIKGSCLEGSYEMVCFSVNHTTCMSEIERSLQNCISKVSPIIPNNLGGMEIELGRKLGQCAGQGYEVSLQSNWSQNNECASILNQFRSLK